MPAVLPRRAAPLNVAVGRMRPTFDRQESWPQAMRIWAQPMGIAQPMSTLTASRLPLYSASA
jgi:hypothetical protein